MYHAAHRDVVNNNNKNFTRSQRKNKENRHTLSRRVQGFRWSAVVYDGIFVFATAPTVADEEAFWERGELLQM